MPSDKKKRRPVLVQMETPNLIPERDLGSIPVLQAEHLGIDFGGLTAVDDFNIAMGRTEISGLIGPNGAGKPARPRSSTCSRASTSLRAAPSSLTATTPRASPSPRSTAWAWPARSRTSGSSRR